MTLSSKSPLENGSAVRKKTSPRTTPCCPKTRWCQRMVWKQIWLICENLLVKRRIAKMGLLVFCTPEDAVVKTEHIEGDHGRIINAYTILLVHPCHVKRILSARSPTCAYHIGIWLHPLCSESLVYHHLWIYRPLASIPCVINFLYQV